jgi:hypothetical protein
MTTARLAIVVTSVLALPNQARIDGSDVLMSRPPAAPL